MKIEKKIIEILKKINGNVLAIGIKDESLISVIENNQAITSCNFLNSLSINSNNNKQRKRLKKISIKNIRKIFKRKKIDFIVCNYLDVEKYLRTFVKDSVYINKNTLYLYGNMNVDELIKKYKRYNTRIEVLSLKDGNILIIDNSLAKNRKHKDLFYSFVDNVSYIADIIGDILIN